MDAPFNWCHSRLSNFVWNITVFVCFWEENLFIWYTSLHKFLLMERDVKNALDISSNLLIVYIWILKFLNSYGNSLFSHSSMAFVNIQRILHFVINFKKDENLCEDICKLSRFILLVIFVYYIRNWSCVSKSWITNLFI